MTLEELAKLGEASALVGIFVATLGAWLSLRSARRQEEDREILIWQKARVWEIIAKEGPLTFDRILALHTPAAVRAGIDKRRQAELQADNLQVILLGLIESRAINVLPVRDINDKELKYSILRYDPAMGDTALDEMLLILSEIERADKPIDEANLKHNLERSGRQMPQFAKHLLRLEMAQMVYRDQNGEYLRREVQRFVIPPGHEQVLRPGAPQQSSAPPGRPQQSVTPSGAPNDLVRDQVLNNIRSKINLRTGKADFTMMSFEELRNGLNKPGWTDEFFGKLIDQYPTVFQRATLSGDRPGIKVI